MFAFALCKFFYFSVKRLKSVPKWSLTYIQPILAAFQVTIAIVKVKLIPDIYTWAILLTNQLKEIALVKETYFLVECVDGGRGANAP